ncbi:pleckstrin homology domain-containing family G member 3-like [Syngnathus typhle]
METTKWLTSRKATFCRGRAQQRPSVVWRGGGSNQRVMALTYLDRVVYEIIETERTYVSDLRMIVEDYLAHIIDQADLSIRPEQVGFLFGNIEDIYEFNSELLQDLDLCQRDAVALARCFVMKSDSFDIYTQYCTNYPNSVAALTDCMQNKSLAVFFCDRQAALKRPLPLGSYLLKPVQRILKYHLLLQEIAKHFDPEEEGYEVVEEAIITMTGVAWYINDMKRKHEHAVRLQEVQSLLLNWKGPDLTTYGELVLEGTFKVYRTKTERTLFLLERLLLVTKRRGEHFVYKLHISCSTLMLIESTKDSLSFSVTHYKQPKQPLTLQTKSVEERKMWAQHIKRIILENHHAIIPQKAKDIILNARYPRRYRPDRLKKALSCDFPQLPSAGQHANTQVGVVSKETERSDVSFNDSNEESGLGEDEEPGGPEAASQRMSTEPLESRPLSEREELNPAQLLLRAKGSPSTTPESQSKPGSSGESSEDEDGEKEADRNGSILPPSVLDKAGAIAEHFSSIKRGAPPADDVGSPGASPRLLVTRRLSFNGRHAGRSSPLNSVSSDLSETDRMLLSPRGDEERGNLGRRDSTLSNRDQILIGKIKTYYENAENQDAGFSLRRRESLTYIPAGVVKTSISRLNSFPNRTDPLPPSVETRSLSLKGHMVSTDSSDGPKVTQRKANPTDSGVVADEFSRSGPDGQQNAEDEEFRPSSEMVKVWQVMEQQLDGTSGHARFKAEGAKLDPDAVSQEATMTSPLNKANSMSPARSPTVPPGVLGAQLPRGENLPDDKADSKVRNLARRYSQRIKTVKPPDRQRSCGNLMGKTLTCVLEEEPCSGPSPNLELVPARSPEPNPARIRSHGPAGAPQATKGFHWPDVRELRSKYSDCSGSATVGRSSSIPEQMFDVLSRSGSLTDAPPRRSYPTWTTGHLRHRNAIHRARSRVPWMTGDLARETQEQLAANGVSDPVTAPTPQEKLTRKPQLSPEPEAGETIDDDAYVEIRSPTSREKISILAVMDRCRAYQESDEYKQRSQPAKSQDSFKTTGEHFQTAGDHLKTPPSGQQNFVKNLREKFQKLNS